jgi:hypothetical protein
VKERKGVLGRATDLAEGVVAGVRRRQQARAPKVLLYDEHGRPRMLDDDVEAAKALIETAQEMVLIGGPIDEPGDDPLDSEDA